MNQRIKELAEQCVDQRLDGLHFDKEMFAELIIKECTELVRGQYLPMKEDKEMMKDTHWNGYVQCGVDSVVAIREHFEVE